MSSAGTVFFAICATVAVLSACGTIASRTPIRAAMALLTHILSLAAIYLTLHAHLLAAMQLIVYAGAVVVLFVFVIMLIGPSQEESETKGFKGGVAKVLSLCLMGAVAVSVAGGVGHMMPDAPIIAGCDEGVAECSQFGGVKAIANVLYRNAAVPFELVSILLLVAILGAIAVARGRTVKEAARLKAERAQAESARLSAEASASPGQ
ncbi:MAG: NADH-quinone oxidoreductase subunit J [Myxococcales bacterium]